MGLTEHNLPHDGRERTYLVHQPEVIARPAAGWPVLLAFHGGGSHALALQQSSGLSQMADRSGFMVVYPQGTAPEHSRRRFWNAGHVDNYAAQQQVDDVGLALAVLDDLARQWPIDRSRVYVTGFSNGAMMAYRLAAEAAPQIAACAAVGGAMALATARPALAVPILHIHGTEDHFAPFAGGRGRHSSGQYQHPSVEQCLAFWATANHCQSQPDVTPLANVVADGTRVEKRQYPPEPGRPDAAPTILYVVHGGGHQWPGQPAIQTQLPPWLKLSRRMHDLGISSGNLDANAVLWQFFAACRRGQCP